MKDNKHESTVLCACKPRSVEFIYWLN